MNVPMKSKREQEMEVQRLMRDANARAVQLQAEQAQRMQTLLAEGQAAQIAKREDEEARERAEATDEEKELLALIGRIRRADPDGQNPDLVRLADDSSRRHRGLQALRNRERRVRLEAERIAAQPKTRILPAQFATAGDVMVVRTVDAESLHLAEFTAASDGSRVKLLPIGFLAPEEAEAFERDLEAERTTRRKGGLATHIANVATLVRAPDWFDLRKVATVAGERIEGEHHWLRWIQDARVLARWALTAEQKHQGPARYQPRNEREVGLMPLADAIIRIAKEKIARQAPGMPASFESALTFWDDDEPSAEAPVVSEETSVAEPMRRRVSRRDAPATASTEVERLDDEEQDAEEVDDVDA